MCDCLSVVTEGDLVGHCLSTTSTQSSCVDCCGRTNFHLSGSLLGCHLLCYERYSAAIGK